MELTYENEMFRVAIHEAAHALVASSLRVSGRALIYKTESTSADDKEFAGKFFFHCKAKSKSSRIKIGLAGEAAEALLQHRFDIDDAHECCMMTFEQDASESDYELAADFTHKHVTETLRILIENRERLIADAIELINEFNRFNHN